jgi:amidophosphoribosyltransferase
MCGVIGVLSPERADVFRDILNGLFQMQHRGQDACGVSLSDGERVRVHKGLGYVREVFADRPGPEFRGHLGCGHVRYPTQGANRLVNAQPHTVIGRDGVSLALASNGDLTNYAEIRRELEAAGMEFAGTNDAELLVTYLAFQHVNCGLSIEDSIRRLQAEVHGAYSACLITCDRLYAFRDPFGFRPLTFGRGEAGWMAASETNALDIGLVDRIDDVHPGEIVRFADETLTRLPHPDVVAARGGRAEAAHCLFEYVYFSRPDSITYGQRVYDVRKRIGSWLAEHDDLIADVVVPVPDSSNAIALGYAQTSGIPFEFGLVRNHYVGRTFISPDQPRRDEGVKHKFNPLRSVFKDKRVVLIDDSVVRGTTSRKLVRMARSAGALEVHVRIGSPVTRHPCYYGIDTPDEGELIGAHLSVDEICSHLSADSLMYMTAEGLKECSALEGGSTPFCLACFDGRYPVPITEVKVRPERSQVPLVLEPAG